MAEMLIGDDIYEVQEIVGIKKSQGRLLYRVRWQGYGAQSDTWEPEENLMLCRDLIQDFLEHRATHKMNNSKIWDIKPSINEGENQPASVSRDTHDSESESFWQQDMYSRVKGRAAKRHQSRQTTGVSSRSKRGRAHVLQALSQSFDNARTLPTNSGARSKPKVPSQQPNSQKRILTKPQCSEKSSLQPASSNNNSTTGAISGESQADTKEPLKDVVSGSPFSIQSNCETAQDPTSLAMDKIRLAQYNPQLVKMESEDGLRLKLQSEIQNVADGMDPMELQALLSMAQWTEKAYELLISCQIWQLEILLHHGADVNCRHHLTRATLLIAAAERGQIEVVQLLLKSGAQKDITDINGQTALMKACAGGHLMVLQELLWAGANFGALDNERRTAQSTMPVVQQVFEKHVSLVTESFEQQVNCTLSNEVKMVETLFPLQCLSVCEGSQFHIHFQHRTQAPKPGIGYLLFIAVAAVFRENAECRLYGRTPVLSVELNNSRQTSLTEDGENFVFPFSPLQDGENVLTILTLPLPKSELKILVCAYNAELTSRAVDAPSKDAQEPSGT